MFTIRPLENTAEDHAQWLELWRGYLGFTKVKSALKPPHTTGRDFTSEQPAGALAAFDANGKMLGIVQTVMHESTWSVARVAT